MNSSQPEPSTDQWGRVAEDGTVFELTSEAGNLGSQSTIVAGGRYNNLIESLGGPATHFNAAWGRLRASVLGPGGQLYVSTSDGTIQRKELAHFE